jgi:hypothetical protein
MTGVQTAAAGMDDADDRHRRDPHPPSPRQLRRPVHAASLPPPPPSSPPTGRRGALPLRPALIFAVAFVLAALLYWPAFEAKVNLPTALYGAPVAVAALAALAEALLGRRPATAFWLGTAVLPAAVFARVVYDGLRDPTSHNLWPFEVAIALGVSAPAALAGAACSWLLLRLAGRKRGADAG